MVEIKFIEFSLLFDFTLTLWRVFTLFESGDRRFSFNSWVLITTFLASRTFYERSRLKRSNVKLNTLTSLEPTVNPHRPSRYTR